MKVQRRVNIEPKRFKLVRVEDESGVSGIGEVAYGVMFDDRTAALHWNTTTSSTTVYKDIDDVVFIHGHEGKTQLEWID